MIFCDDVSNSDLIVMLDEYDMEWEVDFLNILASDTILVPSHLKSQFEESRLFNILNSKYIVRRWKSIKFIDFKHIIREKKLRTLLD